MTFLLSEQRLKADFLNDNVDSALVLSAIQTAQDIYLRQTLGDSLFETICELVENNSVVEPYKTLLDDYIIVYLEYLAMSELCVTSTFKLGNIGIAQSYDSNVNSQSIQNVKYLESFYKQKASTYENRLVTYIQQNINYFPEYLATNEVVTAKESTLQTGIFLGGTKTKTIKKTTTNKNNLNGVVRYDVQQNLSEQQKQQARENIGVSANGDIDINLDNYYTKDEVYNKNQVDTKLAPYITTNEVNLRLDSYYDKNTVNNLLDNLPIPESTSELVKDDVYTKSEVYNKSEVDIKIANVSSGGSVDLSNYYNKQETESLIENIDIPTKTSELELDNVYSKTQVDTLISNVPTFSGDYNDLSNKPSIYTQNEIDTLISNINEFSGDYNDLSNKPDVYTKEQVDNLIENVDVDLSNYYTKEQVYNRNETYSSSQVDTLISQVPTFSGNYNDLSNKPNLFSGSYNDLSDKPTLSNVATSGNYSDLNNLPTLFDGDYNSLENKPQIYTTEQVYNKSEIDLQFETVNATLGNINNILNEI